MCAVSNIPDRHSEELGAVQGRHGACEVRLQAYGVEVRATNNAIIAANGGATTSESEPQPYQVFMEMGRYPMRQIQWLQRTLSYWNKLVANKANSELLDFILAT